MRIHGNNKVTKYSMLQSKGQYGSTNIHSFLLSVFNMSCLRNLWLYAGNIITEMEWLEVLYADIFLENSNLKGQEIVCGISRVISSSQFLSSEAGCKSVVPWSG